jgi:tRNA wybutosine-synthesizing protein 2
VRFVSDISETDGTELALRVPVERTEEIMVEAREHGVYDESRSVRRVGDSTEVPVTSPLDGYRVVEQDEPVRRRVSLGDFVDDPPPYRIVGDVALVRFDEADDEREQAVAEALDEIHDIRVVLDELGVEGETRVPKTRHVSGEHDTETVHHENGFEFSLDPSNVMFSVGNAEERVRMREVVKEGETVFDMFAGIGYFAVPAAVGGASVVAAEIREAAYGYLVENARRNGVADRLDARHADCRDVSVDADRVIMGHFEATRDDFLKHALDCVGEEGVLHVHDAVHEESKDETVHAVEEKARKEGYAAETDARRVKGYTEGVAHIVVDASVRHV